jgi:hypothetical protein
MENDKKLKNFIKTTIREFLNEQKLNENDKPAMMGTQYNQVKILYKLTNDDFSYVPSNVNYWNINTDNTLINKITGHYGKDDEEKYQRAIKNLDFFFIYYNGKQYVYQRHYKTLRDKHDNKIKSSEQSDIFNIQVDEIIQKTLNPTKPIEVF